MSKVKLVLLGILVIILIVFLFFTSHTVPVMEHGGDVLFQMPMWSVILCSVIFGIILGVLLCALRKKASKMH